jgi:hypothetical protein
MFSSVLSRTRLRIVALATVVMWCAVICVPSAAAMPVLRGSGVPAVKMFGYANGPAQQIGTAAGKAHYVPASATRAHPAAASIKGHLAPAADLARPAMGTRTRVTVGTVTMPPGHEVAPAFSFEFQIVNGPDPTARGFQCPAILRLGRQKRQ